MKRSEELKHELQSGVLYDPTDLKLMLEQTKYQRKIDKYNKTPSTALGLLIRQHKLKKILGSVGKDCYIQPPFYANFGGKHVFLGEGVYINYGATFVDDANIYIGDYTMFGPNVTVVTASHPIHQDIRKYGIQYNKQVHIGKRCWIGSGAIILPGVTIGDNTVIGAGSVVTKDIPSNVVAFGNPCKKHRDITEEDLKVFDHNKPIPDEFK